MFSVRAIRIPRLGNTQAECEDSFTYDRDRSRFCVSDGASSSYNSGLWSHFLTRIFVYDIEDSSLSDSSSLIMSLVRKARRKWYRSIDWASLAWWERNKALEGSSATFLGLKIEEDETGVYSYRALAVGDSCLFKRNDDTFESFPITRIEMFNNSPPLLWSGLGYPAPEDRVPNQPIPVNDSGLLREGESIILATDKISEWMMDEHNEERRKLLCELAEKNPKDKILRHFISEQISQGTLSNDDITLVVVSICS
jgi:serine/threonine protein phosphatase PrpC